MTISNERLEELLKGSKWSEDLLGDAGVMKGLKIAEIKVVETIKAGVTVYTA